MKKLLVGKTFLIVVLIVFAIFNVIYWPIAAPRIATIVAGGWLAYGFACFAFLVPAVASLLKTKSKTTQTETTPFLLTGIVYFFVAFITNIIFMSVNPVKIIAGLILNLIYILLAAIAFVIFYRYSSRVSKNTEVRENRMEAWRMVGVEVVSLRNYTEDADIIAAINALRDNVNNSSSASNEACKPSEEELHEQLIAIKTLLKNNADKETVLKAIKVAENILKTRNQMIMAARRN